MKKYLALIVVFTFFCLGSIPAIAQRPPVQQKMADNALIDLSPDLINAVVASDLDQTEKVRDVILGNPVYGMARMKGKVSAVLVPDVGNGVVDIYVKGTILSDTVAVPPERNLLIYSNSTMPIIVRKRIYVNETGIHAFPTQARVSINTKLRKITNLQGQTGTLATTLGEEGFELTRGAAEREAMGKAQTKLIKEFDDKFQPQLVQGNTAFTNALQQVKALGVPLQRFHFSTIPSSLTLGALIATTGSLPPQSPSPQLSGPFDLAGRVHQTAINETAQALLGGKTFNVQDLGSLPGASKMNQAQAQLVQHFLGAIPKDLGEKAVFITFAAQEPLTVAFADHGLTLTIRLQEIRTGALRLPGLTTRVVYRIENAPARVDLVRQGPVQVEPSQHTKIGNRTVGAVLQSSLEQVFKSRLAVPPLHPPTGISQIGTLVPAHGDAENGWLMLTWVRQIPR